MAQLTRAQIIAEALSQVGRTDLTSKARLWLNLFLEKAYANYDWIWLLKDAGTLSLTNGGAVFSDYRKLKSANLIYNGQVQCPILSVDGEDWLALKRRGTSSGSPIRVYADKEAGTFNFWPAPNLSYSWNPLYYKMPALPDYTDAATDSQTPTWGEAQEVMIRGVQLKALYYNDDARYDKEVEALFQEIIQSKMNSYDKRAGSNTLKFGKSFRKRIV